MNTYSAPARQAVRSYIESHFGPCARRIPGGPEEPDLWVIEPTVEKEARLLVTFGLGAAPMPVPERFRGMGLDRAELVLELPPDWAIDASDWAQRFLWRTASLPRERGVWLCYGTAAETGPVPGAPFTGAVIDFTGEEDEEECALPDGSTVNFFQAVPVYPAELAFARSHTAEELLGRLDALENVLDPRRGPCETGERPARETVPDAAAAPAAAGDLLIAERDLRPLLTDWTGPDGCTVSDRIVRDGAPAGLLYRTGPAGRGDSGWHVLAGDETEASHLRTLPLNTVCNYDPNILPLLRSPAGSAYRRGADGVFRPDAGPETE